MLIQVAKEEYALAMKQGQKEYREHLMAGLPVGPLVLDEILPSIDSETVQDIGLVEIPAQRIIGTKTAARTTAFSPSFRPLLDVDSEFGAKWVILCSAHLGETGIQNPIECYEYLGNFYVQEGNKRVSVLRYFDAPRIPGMVKRILPPVSEEPRIKAYYEFLDFYKDTGLYTVQFRRPGDYAWLLSHLGKKPGETWTKDEKRTFSAFFHYFEEAFDSLNTKREDVLPEEALLLWLKVHPFQELGNMTATQIRKSLSVLWEDVVSSSNADAVEVKTKAEDGPKANIFTRIIASAYEHLNVAFIHQLDNITSNWVLGHEEGKAHIEAVFGDKVTVRSYYDANTTALAEEKIDQAVADGAQVVFVTAPILSRATLRASVKYPKVRFLNCSVDQPYSSVRTYYGRMYEAKFITGAIAGAMADDDHIGYIAAYPIFGEPASINAFALGAQMTNPRAKVHLRWSCLPGSPRAEFLQKDIRVVSNRDVPTPDKIFLNFCSYGTYVLDDHDNMRTLASPTWVWGKFYEYVIRNVFSGGWKQEKGLSTAVNYWLGMDSGIIGINFSDTIPEGVLYLAKLLQQQISTGALEPFARRIVAQDGTVKNDGHRSFKPHELLHMDWLCENVEGRIPSFDEILPISQAVVRELGIYRDQIPPEEEGLL